MPQATARRARTSRSRRTSATVLTTTTASTTATTASSSTRPLRRRTPVRPPLPLRAPPAAGPAGPQGPAGPAGPAGAAPKGAVLGSRSSSRRACVSRRHFTIRIRQHKGARIAKATLSLRGKRVRTVKGKRVTAPIVLRGLPKGAFSLRIRAVTTAGKRLDGTRVYHTCAPKRRSHVPSL